MNQADITLPKPSTAARWTSRASHQIFREFRNAKASPVRSSVGVPHARTGSPQRSAALPSRKPRPLREHRTRGSDSRLSRPLGCSPHGHSSAGRPSPVARRRQRLCNTVSAVHAPHELRLRQETAADVRGRLGPCLRQRICRRARAQPSCGPRTRACPRPRSHVATARGLSHVPKEAIECLHSDASDTSSGELANAAGAAVSGRRTSRRAAGRHAQGDHRPRYPPVAARGSAVRAHVRRDPTPTSRTNARRQQLCVRPDRLATHAQPVSVPRERRRRTSPPKRTESGAWKPHTATSPCPSPGQTKHAELGDGVFLTSSSHSYLFQRPRQRAGSESTGASSLRIILMGVEGLDPRPSCL